MKKLLLISTIVLGTFASAGIASAADVTAGTYTGWSGTAMDIGGDR